MKTKGSIGIRIARVAIVLAASGFMGLGYARNTNGDKGMQNISRTMQDMAKRMETGRMGHQEMQAMADRMRQMSK